MTTSVQLKGSLFDEELIGTIEVPAPPEVGDVLECKGKSYTVTDLIQEGADGLAQIAHADVNPAVMLVAIVEPLAVSQRRASIFPPR